MKVTSSSGAFSTICQNNTYCYLKKENQKLLKFCVINSPYFEISTCLF